MNIGQGQNGKPGEYSYRMRSVARLLDSNPNCVRPVSRRVNGSVHEAKCIFVVDPSLPSVCLRGDSQETRGAIVGRVSDASAPLFPAPAWW